MFLLLLCETDSFSISNSIYTYIEWKRKKKHVRLIYIPSTEILSFIKICGLWFVNISYSIYSIVSCRLSARIFRIISFSRIVVCILSTMSQSLDSRTVSRRSIPLRTSSASFSDCNASGFVGRMRRHSVTQREIQSPFRLSLSRWRARLL